MNGNVVRVERVTDPGDPRLSDYVGLTDVALRSRQEPEWGLYLAESDKVIRRALAAGHRPRSLLLAERWLEPLGGLVEAVAGSGAPVYTGEPAVLESITGFHVHRGAIAAMHRPALRPVADVVAGAVLGEGTRPRLAIFEDIVDHTNLGAAFRSCAALGVDAVLVTPRCADPLYRRSVRVSMGAVFQVPWTRLPDWPAELELIHDAGFTTVALGLQDDAIELGDLTRLHPGPLALVLGTEGDGLSRRTMAAADVVCRIPMSGGVDSLNVAAAAAVAFWETR
jgi:tRNA G18 (ribose-2'-O)-methylase SpoU